MTWATTPPTEAGDYYYRECPDSTPEIITLEEDRMGDLRTTDYELIQDFVGSGEWLRIPSPAEIAAMEEERDALREYYEAAEAWDAIFVVPDVLHPLEKAIVAARERVQALNKEEPR